MLTDKTEEIQDQKANSPKSRENTSKKISSKSEHDLSMTLTKSMSNISVAPGDRIKFASGLQVEKSLRNLKESFQRQMHTQALQETGNFQNA